MVLLKQKEATKGKTAKHAYIPCDFYLVWKQGPTESLVAFLCFAAGIVRVTSKAFYVKSADSLRGDRVSEKATWCLLPGSETTSKAGLVAAVTHWVFTSRVPLPHILHNPVSAVIRKVAWPWGNSCRKPLAIVKWLTFQSLVLKTKDFNHKLARPERPI